jgi:tetratricopeptide (TPR) repeat protein
LELARKCAMTLYSDGRWEEAKELFMQVMETRKRVLGEEHPSTLISMADLASTYRNQERWKEAEKLFVQVMETRKRVLGEEHPDTLISMANLASTYSDGRWEEAKELFVQVMETSSRVLGEEHPSTLTSMANLASLYRKQGRWKEAEELDVQVMEASSRVLGPEHPSTLTSMSNLASTYRDQGRWKEAEKLEVQVMETSSRVLGPEYPDTLASMINLALVLRRQGKYEEAEAINRQTLALSETVLGRKHPSTLTSMSNLSGVQESQGKFEEADLMYMRKLKGTEKTVLQDTGNEDGSQLLTLEPQVYDDFTTTSTLQGQSSIGVSQSETLAGEEQMSNQARDSLIDEMYDGDPLEASSVSSRVTTARDKDGKAHIAYFLATNPELRILCSGMMDKVDKAEFADTGRRLLKTFYLGLLEDAQTELQIQSVRLLKSRRSRVRISKDIVDIITSADAQDAKEKGEVMEQNRMRKERLEDWAERYAHTPLDNKTSQLLEAEQHEQWTRKYPYEDHENPWIQEDGGNQGDQEERDEKHGTYSDAEPESEIENDENTLPNLTEMEAFFRNSESFQVLIYGFKKLLLPESLRDIVSSTSVELSNEEDESMVNYMKALVEDYTMLDWNWWPLESRMRPLNPDESRLIWHCVSKRKSWQCSRS